MKFDVTVVDYPAKRLIGLKVQTTMPKASIDCPAIWDVFGPRMGELQAAGTTPAGSFGVCVMLNAEEFDYWAAVEADATAAVPQGMGVIDLPAGLYAKAVVPNLEQVGEAFNYLYSEWRKERQDYVCDEAAPSFEFYGPNWQPTDILEVFMPIKKCW